MAKLSNEQCDAAGNTFAAILRKMPSGDSEKLQAFIEARSGDTFRQLAVDTFTLVEQPDPSAKFALLVDLGIITVPADYVHGTRLATFGDQNREKFYYYNGDITDKKFPNPSRILKPGDKLRVRAFKQIVSGETTSEERMAFLATQKAVHTGAQGSSLVFEQKRDQLPKGYWYASFDKKEKLWKDADGHHRVPFVYAYSDGDFSFYLGFFEYAWRDVHAFLCFCDE